MRSTRCFTMLAAVTCLGAAACGSSKHAVSNTTPVATSVASDPAPTPTVRTAKTRPHKAKTHPVTGSSRTSTAPTAVAVASAFHRPIPTGCLRQNGYRFFYYVETGILAASRAPAAHHDVNAHVYVDGPYPTRAAAAKAAQGLIGVEYAASGGLYEVSATLRSHARSAVAAIAACLAGRPARKKSFGF